MRMPCVVDLACGFGRRLQVLFGKTTGVDMTEDRNRQRVVLTRPVRVPRRRLGLVDVVRGVSSIISCCCIIVIC